MYNLMSGSKADSVPIAISAFILGSAIIFGYFNSLFSTFTLLMMLYGFVAMLGGLAHRFSGEWGVVNLIIGVFGVILLLAWFSIDFMLMADGITLSTAEIFRSFWKGFTFLIILGVIYVVGEFQIMD